MKYGSQQQQIYAQANIQQQNEITYTLNQDFQNILGVALEFYAVEQNKQNLNPDLVKVQRNRLILQFNLSNGINCDLQSQCKSSDQKTFLKQKKTDIRKTLASIKETLNSKNPDFCESEAFQLLNEYEKINLNDHVMLNQKTPEEVNVEGRFDEQVLSKVVSSIQANNQVYDDINNSKTPIKVDSPKQILDKTISRYNNAQLKLKSQLNKPIQNNQNNSNGNSIQCNQKIDETYPQNFRILFGGLYYYYQNQSNSGVILTLIRIHIKLMQRDTQNKLQIRSLLCKFKNQLSNLYYFCDQFINYIYIDKEEQNPFVMLPKIVLNQEDFSFLLGYAQITKQFWETKIKNVLKLSKDFLQNLLLIYTNATIQNVYQLDDQYEQEFLAILINDYLFQIKSPFFEGELRKQMISLYQGRQKKDLQEDFDIKTIQQNLEQLNRILS